MNRVEELRQERALVTSVQMRWCGGARMFYKRSSFCVFYSCIYISVDGKMTSQTVGSVPIKVDRVPNLRM